MATSTNMSLQSATTLTAATNTTAASRQNQRASSNIKCINCNTDEGADSRRSPMKIDRRNVLLTLGGLYGAAGLGSKQIAVGNPIQPPDLNKCHSASYQLDDGTPVTMECCPPYDLPVDITDYKFPTKMPLRVRKPAHLLTQEDLEKFELAITKMKNLDKDDPWNFMRQAQIHCAYCNGAYNQLGFEIPLQVHFSWLFLPWHRYYLYFYERILGKLIGDETFAFPFWNYDTPEGMYMPPSYTVPTSPLYNSNRNPDHITALLDYKYSYTNPSGGGTPEDVIAGNLHELHKIFKDSLPRAELFMGQPLKAGDSSSSSGRMESLHNVMHMWAGLPEDPHFDMGNFATAARDIIFYSHHCNVDRLWHLYRTYRGNKVEFDDKDWLDASFIFYDENRKVVKVKVKDSLNALKFGYTYEDVPILWMTSKPPKRPAAKTRSKRSFSMIPVSEFGTEPRVLDAPIRALVSRPKTSRIKAEKDEEVEVLIINDIQVAQDGPARFDVYVSVPYGEFAGPDYGDFAGSFTKLPHHKHSHKKHDDAKAKKMNLKLGITSVVEDLNADAAGKLVVTLLPRHGEVTVGGVQIDLVEAN